MSARRTKTEPKKVGSDYFYGTVNVDRTAIVTAIVTAHARNHVLTIESKWLTTYHCVWEQSFLLLKSFLRVSKVMKKEILSHSIPEALALSKQRGEGLLTRSLTISFTTLSWIMHVYMEVECTSQSLAVERIRSEVVILLVS